MMVFSKARNHAQSRISDTSVTLISSLLSYSKACDILRTSSSAFGYLGFSLEHLRIVANFLLRQFSFKKLEVFETAVWDFQVGRQRIQDMRIEQRFFMWNMTFVAHLRDFQTSVC